MKFGLTDPQYLLIKNCFSKLPEVQKVILFGSRAMGNHKLTSDIDFMVIGDRVSNLTMTRLHGMLNEELSVPFRFDLLNSNEPMPPDLKKHILQYGVEFYP
jgi:predicted nucleotidyltransferase